MHLANCSAYFDEMSKIAPRKVRDMEGRATEGAVWRSRVEKYINLPIVHKEICEFHAKNPLAKAVPES